jgi:hypothetical protein
MFVTMSEGGFKTGGPGVFDNFWPNLSDYISQPENDKSGEGSLEASLTPL